MEFTPVKTRRLNQLNVLKWCFIGIAIIDIFLLFFINVTSNVIQDIISSGSIPPNMSIKELNEAKDFFETIYWPFNILGLLHLPLTLFSFLRFHQKKWHILIPVYAVFSLFIFPIGTLLGIVLFVFLYQSGGKDLFQK